MKDVLIHVILYFQLVCGFFGLFQISHLFNVAHTLRLLVQKERSLEILKVSSLLTALG